MTQEELAEQVGTVDGCLHQIAHHADQLRKGIEITLQHLRLRPNLRPYALALVESALRAPTSDLKAYEAGILAAKDALLKAFDQASRERP